jgi:hypothetical protein
MSRVVDHDDPVLGLLTTLDSAVEFQTWAT